MADFYCDHGAYATNLGATPTWGSPQEGDGSSKDAATASAVASIALSAIPTSGTFSCCGVTISTTGVIGAATVTAAADTLAANINATTTTVASGVAVGTPQLRNLVYARGPTDGAPAGTCQIMMRIGSETLNYAANVSAAIASTFTGTPTITQFAGGAGGCWGWMENTVSLGVSSSLAIGQYGLRSLAVPYVCAQGSVVQKPTFSDPIWVRNGKTITFPNSPLNLVTKQRTYEPQFIIDNGTVWAGDSQSGVFSVEIYPPGSNTTNYALNTSFSGAHKQVSFRAIEPGCLVFKAIGTNTSANLNFELGAGCRLENATIIEDVELSSSGIISVAALNTYQAHNAYVNCFFDFRPSRAAFARGYFFSPSPSAAAGTTDFIGCRLSFNISGGGDPGPIVNIPTALGNSSVRFRDCSFSGYAAKFRAFGGVATSWAYNEYVFENCSGVKLDAAYVGLTAFATNPLSDSAAIMQFSSADIGHQFRYECQSGALDWNPDASPAYPTFGAVQPDGTEYAIRLDWFPTAAQTPSRPFWSPKFSMLFVATSAAKTVTLHLMTPTAVTLNSRHLGLHVFYIDGSGIPRSESTLLKAVPVASGATWVNADSWSSHEATKLTLTTQYAVKQNTEISARVSINTPSPTGTLQSVFVSPEFALS